MKLRSILYGYAVKNGENILHPDESKIVRQVYEDYIGGKSFITIAQALTSENISFLPGRSDWNKNRVKRILEDIRYTGTNTHPVIISAEMFHRVQVVKDSKNNQHDDKSVINSLLSCSVECHCGEKMFRRHSAQRKASLDYWTCTNTECKFIVNINDDALLKEITVLLNRLIADPSLIWIDSTDKSEPSMEARRLNNEVSRQLDSLDFDKENLKTKILALASEKYKQIDSNRYISNMLRVGFEQQTPLSHFSEGLFKRTALKIWFSKNGNPVLVLKNNQHIGKEFADHANADNIRAAH